MQSLIYSKPFKEVVEDLNQLNELPQLVNGLDGSSQSILIAQMYLSNPRQLLIVDSNESNINNLESDLTSLLSDDVPVLQFPVEDVLALEFAEASYDALSERVQVLELLESGKPCIILTTASGIRKQLTPPEEWRKQQLTLALGDEIEFRELEERLVYFGYRKEAMVQSPGEYSIRGGIVDFYPLNATLPIRLDFFDTELDSIRLFNATTQESTRNLQNVKISPAKDVLFSIKEQQKLLPELRLRLADVCEKMDDQVLASQLDSLMSEQLNQLEQGEPLKYPEAYLSLYYKESASLIDYMEENGQIVINEYGKIQQNEIRQNEEDFFWIEQEIVKGQFISGISVKQSATEILRENKRNTVHFSVLQRGLANFSFSKIHNFHQQGITQYFNQMEFVKEEIEQWQSVGRVIQVCVNDAKSARRTQTLFEEIGIQPVVIQTGEEINSGIVYIVSQGLLKGFELPQQNWVVITENELFNRTKTRRVRNNQLSNAERIKSYNELQEGDYVVHQSHGIGIYTGMETMEIGGVHKDMLAIEYQDKARVLVPIEKLSLLQKYIASESAKPKINRLGGKEWARTKKKVQSRIEDIADELIALYAEREQAKGYAFSADTQEQHEFEEAFPYVETEDQLRSSNEIKKDMEAERPMDRLLVGDVGYGKTEVAMRAIFKAVMDGKQVAFLVPTTILAQQHYNSLMERFKDYPFEIGLLSRFVKRSVQNKTIEKLKNGAISIVVGTHRLLSKDVAFLDLGLLIIDEEQRFGVRHKERVKRLKAQVDVLTLTATPIPRTLHMSMIGVRDLSLIETPPNNRFPVQTYVMEKNDGAIKSGIEREMSRGGQVFYLYNRVATIEQRAMELADLVPSARIAVAHGQMNETELEDVLVSFIQGDYDILVTTTIIETGVDIPNANTLFVENADHMGLSTLYQLRGRVGRTHRVAYAYLMYEPFKQLTEVSEKRLQAIHEFTELGSGFKIAMRDLSIRGAGNLLGQQQSGFIDSVGYDMFTQLLKEAVEIRQGKKPAKELTHSDSLDWQVNIDAYIPSEYISDEQQKINVYKQIQAIDSLESYRNIQDELIDRFGEFPNEVSDLLDVAIIRYNALNAGVTRIKQDRKQVQVWFNESASEHLKGPNIFQALENVSFKAQVQLEKECIRLTLDTSGSDTDQWLSGLIKLTQRASELLLDRKVGGGEKSEIR